MEGQGSKPQESSSVPLPPPSPLSSFSKVVLDYPKREKAQVLISHRIFFWQMVPMKLLEVLETVVVDCRRTDDGWSEEILSGVE